MTRNVFVIGNRDILHETIKAHICIWALRNGYWFECEPVDYMTLERYVRNAIMIEMIRINL